MKATLMIKKKSVKKRRKWLLNPSPLFIWDFLISPLSTYHGVFCVKFCHELEWCQQSFTLSHVLSHTGEAQSSGEHRFLPVRSLSSLVTSVLDRRWSAADLQWQWNLRHSTRQHTATHEGVFICGHVALLVSPSLLAALCPQRVDAAGAGVCNGVFVSLPSLINVLPRRCHAAFFMN